MRNLNQLPTALLAWMSAHTTQDENQSTDSVSNASPEKSLDPPIPANTNININLLKALIACFPASSNPDPNPDPSPENFKTLKKWLEEKGIKPNNKNTKNDGNNDGNNKENDDDNKNIVFLCLLEILLNDLVEQPKSKSESEKKISSQHTNQDKASVWKKIRFYILATLMGIFTSTEAFGSGLLIASVITSKFSIQFIIASVITAIAIALVATIEIRNMADEMGISYLKAKNKYSSILLINDLNTRIGVHLEHMCKNENSGVDIDTLKLIFIKLKEIESKNTNAAIRLLDYNKEHKTRRLIIKNMISFLAATLTAAITYMTAISSIHSAAGFALSAAAISSPLGIAITSIVVVAWIVTYLFSWYCFERKVMTGTLSGLLSIEKDRKLELRQIAGIGYKKPKDPDPRSGASFFAESLKNKIKLAELESNSIRST